MASFTAHTLPVWANWSQFLSGFTLVAGLSGAYFKHRCHARGCLRIARHTDGPTGRPTCKRHSRAR